MPDYYAGQGWKETRVRPQNRLEQQLIQFLTLKNIFIEN